MRGSSLKVDLPEASLSSLNSNYVNGPSHSTTLTASGELKHGHGHAPTVWGRSSVLAQSLSSFLLSPPNLSPSTAAPLSASSVDSSPTRSLLLLLRYLVLFLLPSRPLYGLSANARREDAGSYCSPKTRDMSGYYDFQLSPTPRAESELQ